MGSGVSRRTLAGGTFVKIWGSVFSEIVDTASATLGERWTTSVPRVAFLNRSMNGRTGSFPAMSAIRQKVTSGRLVATLTPCAEPALCRPEDYFTFNTRNGAITPLRELDTNRFEKAQEMIADLKLNDKHHMDRRRVTLELLELSIPRDPREETPISRKLRRFFASRSYELSSLTRTWLVDRGYAVED